MPGLPTRIRWLHRLPRAARVVSLDAALRYADEKERDPLAEALVEELVRAASMPRWFGRVRRRTIDDVWPAVLRSWPVIRPDLRAAALASVGDGLFRCFESGTLSSDEAELSGLAAVAGEVRSPEAIRTIGALLLHEHGSVAEAAELSLLAVTRDCEGLNTLSLASLDRVLADAARTYEQHRRRGVMQAVAMAAARPGPALLSWLGEEDHPAHMALRAVIRRAEGDGLSIRCVRLLAHPAPAPAAMDRLMRRDSGAMWWSFLAETHLLQNTSRRRCLRRMAKPGSLLPETREITVLSADARRGLPAWVAALPLTGAERAARMLVLLTDADPITRWRAVGVLGADAPVEPAAREALLDFAYDRDARVARRAMVSLLCDRTMESGEKCDAFGKLARSPHECVRVLALRDLREADMWSACADRWSSGVAARRRLADDREGVVGELRRRIRDGAAAERIGAIGLAARLGVEKEVELELLGAAAGNDPRTTATAVRALGAMKSDSARIALRSCLDHADARVRANAVESLGASEPASDRIIEAMGDADPRTSANAVRVRILAGDDDAVQRLASMLSDDDPRRRLSGLWVAERVGRDSLAGRVAHLARDDDDEQVRRRADRCARRMLGRMRTSWTHAAAHDSADRETPWS